MASPIAKCRAEQLIMPADDDDNVRTLHARAVRAAPLASPRVPTHPFTIEVLLGWSGRKFTIGADPAELLPELRRRVLDEAGLRGEWGGANPRSCRIVTQGKELPREGGGPAGDHIGDRSRLLVLGARR
jgi:hypothetical protein